MPKSLINSIRHKNNPYKLCVAKPTKENIDSYKQFNNKLTSIKRTVERNHYSNQLDINKGDMKKSWNIMKTIIGKTKTTPNKISYFLLNNVKLSNKTRIANEFNNYFVSVGPLLAANIKATKINPLEHISVQCNSMVIPYIPEHEIVSIIKSLKKIAALGGIVCHLQFLKT